MSDNEKDLEELNIKLEKRQMCQFLKYYELLVEWNSFMNLTAITDFDEVNLRIHKLRKMAYHKVDEAIDMATADFLKSKLKNID